LKNVNTALFFVLFYVTSETIVNGNKLFTGFKGALTEQYVLQQLIIKHTPYYYSKSNSQQEIDFLIETPDMVVPIEVKAEENLKAKSLRQFLLSILAVHCLLSGIMQRVFGTFL